VPSESSSKSDQENISNHETDTQNHLSNRDDSKTFVTSFVDLHNFVTRSNDMVLGNIAECHRASCVQYLVYCRIYCHLYICFFQFHFLRFNLLSLFSSLICLNVSSVSFQKQKMQKESTDLISNEIINNT